MATPATLPEITCPCNGSSRRYDYDPERKIDLVTCLGCGRSLNPVAVLLGPVCGPCVRKRHAAAIGKGARS